MKKLLVTLFLFSATFAVFSQEGQLNFPRSAISPSESSGKLTKEKISKSIEDFSINQNESSAEDEKGTDPLQTDFEFRLYTIPSAMGFVAGSGSYMKLREDYTVVTKAHNLFLDSRVSFANVNNFSFATGVALDLYMENQASDGSQYLSFSLSLGAGAYYHFYKDTKFALTGLYVYLYPLYSLPLCLLADTGDGNTIDYSVNDFAWKVAAEVGLTGKLSYFTLSPYMRTALAWTKSGTVKAAVDFGISIGLYIPDRHYFESVYGEY